MSAGRHVLLVDDDSTFCTVLQRALARRGHRVRTAHSVQTAMAQAATDPPEWAVVDLKMPGESGLALIAGLRALAPGMCIVVLTGYASVATAVGDVVVLSESEPHAGSHDNESTTIAGNHARKAGPFFI